MCIMQFRVFVGIILLKFIEQVPIDTESLHKFQDDWDYKIQPHNSPMLNVSQRQYALPLYSFINDLKVQGLQKNGTSSTYLPISRESKMVGDVIRSKVSCNLCNLGVGLLYREVKNGTPFETIKEKFVSICVAFKIENFNVCSGIFDTYAPEVIPVLEIISIGGEIVINGLVDIPEVGLPIEEKVRIKDDSVTLGNNTYYILTEENENDHLTRTDSDEEKREAREETPSAEKSRRLNVRVRSPLKTIKNTPRAVRQTAASKVAIDLVRATEETNTIKENYYIERIQIMQDSLEIKKQCVEIQKQSLKVQERIAVGLEILLKK